MAFYKKPCIFCGALIDSNCQSCEKCGKRNPFEILCPECLWEVSLNDTICTGCGRALVIDCPECGEKTFVLDQCQICGAKLVVPCQNRRCGEPVFFLNTHCRACGGKNSISMR